MNIEMKNIRKILKFATLNLITLLVLWGCVESINDGTTGSDLTPTITISDPTSGDTVKAGIVDITYDAIDKAGGAGIDYFEVRYGYPFDYYVTFDQDEEASDLVDLYLELDTSLVGTSFSYWVNVINMDGEMASSSVQENVYVIENTDPPDAPKGLKIVTINENSLTLKWNDVLRESGYRLYRKDGISGIYRLWKSYEANTVIVEETNLSEYVEYFYKLTAFNQYGESEYSAEVSSKGSTSSTAPSELQAQSLGATKALLTWTNNTTSSGLIEIERKITAATAWDTVALISNSYSEYTDQGLIGSTSYTYRISVYVSSVKSDYSNEAVVVTAQEDAFAPANLKASFNYNTKNVVVSWDNNNATGEISHTFIERKELNASEFEAIGSVDYSSNQYVDSSLVYDKSYEYRARFYHIEEFYTPYSNTDSAYVPILPPTLSITEFEFGKQYFLQWDYDAQNETGFELQRRSSNGEFSTLSIFDIDTKAYIDNIPDSTKIYLYRVRAFQGTDSLTFSNTVSTAGGTGDILRPTNLTASVPEDALQVELSWSDNSDNELAFELERRRESTSTWTTLKVLPYDRTSYIDTDGIFSGETWEYRVRAVNGSGYSGYSDIATIYIPYQ